ncbi:oxidoreductase [Levilactobacillus brevis ATCC 14869 = DSM 20054]|uniref:Putative chlorophyll synthesis pathway protein BchC n=1 Tax=Levilactobacillus brevis ATCC 14869 = DSM 20054 TaxID=649758 RepID=U2PM85_LEVBR|nr:putative chlorophyll synthesis pathway protein BchC [Levilactobacillus brevis ATCC 14869 = DSM 20054]KRK20619.1 oxidoreductase [Levilactobacillus brevis ATCC 14869 = DSM 20054]
MKEGHRLKTIAIDKYGTAKEFYAAEMPQPVPQADEVLVKVHAFSINPMDIAGRMGALGAPFTDLWSFPLVLGWDFAGTVAQVGDQVTGFAVGEAVFGSVASAHAANNGTYGEYVAAGTKELAHIPAGLSFDQAAALPIAGMTAYYGMKHNLNLQAGQKILIQGGAGGVGLFAVQIAKAFGAHVATTASENHREMLEQLGADEVIDYHQTSPAEVLHDYDAVFDTVGDIETGLKVLKADGQLATIAGQPTPEQQHDQQKKVAFQFTNGSSADLTALAGLVTSGKIKLTLDVHDFTVENVIAAHETIEAHHTTGKIVIHVTD